MLQSCLIQSDSHLVALRLEEMETKYKACAEIIWFEIYPHSKAKHPKVDYEVNAR